MKCAVIGMLNGSPIEPPGVPPMISAILRTAWLATGIQVGFGLAVALARGQVPAPGPGSSVKVVIELSRVCITSAITVRSDQCLTS